MSWPAIDQADLPEPLKASIRQIVTRVRWRPASRQRLAEQIIGGCREQLKFGATVEVVLGSLPDSRSAVKRMRREGTIAREPLPEPLRTLVNEAVRKTRLYRWDKLDVAGELFDHFSDGLRAGKTANELAVSFGPVPQAARLIRRAKTRGRAWYHQLLTFVVRATMFAVATTLVAWSFVAIRYFSAAPNISRNYLAEMDDEFARIPANDRAWPLYRQALMELPSTAFAGHDAWNDANELSDEARRIVSEHRNAVRLIREAAGRSRFGFSFEDPSNREWLLSHEQFAPDDIANFQATDKPVVSTLLPHVQSIRKLGYLLAADSIVAAERKDASAVTENVLAMLTLADRFRDSHSFLVTQLVSLAMLDQAAQLTGRLLEQFPELLSDEQLQRVALGFNNYTDGGRLTFEWDGERLFFADAMQRIYSDNGKGDGVLTTEGIELLSHWTSGEKDIPAADVVSKLFVGPWQSFQVAGRREIESLADRMYDFLESESRKPRWQRKSLDNEPELAHAIGDRSNSQRWLPLTLWAPSYESALTTLDLYTQKRDAIVTVIALHRFRRQHGDWPTSLAELVPEYQREVPLDQFDGQPLRYRVERNEPLLYSVGIDAVDDQGRPPDDDGLRAPRANDVDLILWPPVRTGRHISE